MDGEQIIAFTFQDVRPFAIRCTGDEQLNQISVRLGGGVIHHILEPVEARLFLHHVDHLTVDAIRPLLPKHHLGDPAP